MARKKKSAKKKLTPAKKGKAAPKRAPRKSKKPAKKAAKKKYAKKAGPGLAGPRRLQAVAGEVTGACRYLDQDGRMTCEDGVTKSYCDGKKGSTFIPHGRCG